MPANPAQQATTPPEFPGSTSAAPQSLASNYLVDLQFISGTSGYAVTDLGDILASDDGGQSWRFLRPVDIGFGYPKRVRFHR